MSDLSQSSRLIDRDEYRALCILEAVEENPAVSQRELAASLGVALGIVNACMHALVRKGMVKVHGANNRSLTYHLTKKGIGQKAVLALKWTRNTVDFYRQARGFVAGELGQLAAQGCRRVLIYGAGDLAEITLIAAADFSIEVVGVIRDPRDHPRERIATLAVGDLRQLKETEADAVVITVEDIDQETLRALSSAAHGAELSEYLVPVINRDGFWAGMSELDLDKSMVANMPESWGP